MKNNEYFPDMWSVLKIRDSKTKKVVYKLFAGWYGSYLEGASWKLNSGITKIKDEDLGYAVEGYSGSVYYCNKESENINYYLQGIFNSWAADVPDHIKLTLIPMSKVPKGYFK